MKAFGPNGKEIVSIHTVVHGTNRVSDFSRSPRGLLYRFGSGMDIVWGTAREELVDGKLVFFDTDGNDWSEDDLDVREEEAAA